MISITMTINPILKTKRKANIPPNRTRETLPSVSKKKVTSGEVSKIRNSSQKNGDQNVVGKTINHLIYLRKKNN